MIEAKGLDTYNAAVCVAFGQSSFESSDNDSPPPAAEQINILINVPLDGVMRRFEFRETAN